MSCGVGHRLGSDPELLLLWFRPAATAPIRPLTWEPFYAMGETLEKGKKTKKKKKKKKKKKQTNKKGMSERVKQKEEVDSQISR